MGIRGAVLRGLLLTKFDKAGFTPEENGRWISRDPFTDKWILWSTRAKLMFRKTDAPDAEWRPSPESERECLALGRAYEARMSH